MKKEKFSINLLFFFVIILLTINYVSALSGGYCVNSSVSDISPSSIGIGEEFTVGVQIENCGGEVPKYVSFELIHPPSEITIKEPLLMNISRLYYGDSERFITYHMRTGNNAPPGTYLIKTRLIYWGDGYSLVENSEIEITIIGEEAELSIASIKTDPVIPKKGDTVELTLRIENTGDGMAKSVVVYANHSFKGLKQSFIGALGSDEDGPAILTFIVDKPGEFEFPITISYTDDFGEKIIQTKATITVLRKQINWVSIIIYLVIILLIIWGVFRYFKLKKTKDKIIHQLLEGNGNTNFHKQAENIKKHDERSKREKEEQEKKERIRREYRRQLLEKYKK